MPITKSAIKKQRVDKRRSAINEPIRGRVKAAIKIVRSKPSTETLAQFYAAIDRAVAKELVSKRTAARMKARVVLAWALSFGKWAVIVTQLVVMGAFLWRFGLDRRMTDLKKETEKNIAIINSYEQIERDFALTQKRIKTIEPVVDRQEKLLASLDKLERITPIEVWYERINLSEDSISLVAYAKSVAGMGRLIRMVENDPEFTQVRLNKLESSGNDDSQLTFELSITQAQEG